MSRLTLAILLIILIFCTAIAVMLYVSLVPYFSLIGKIAIVCVIILATCAMIFVIIFTYTKSTTMLHNARQAKLQSRIVSSGEVVVMILTDGTLVHLSAQHEAAKVPPMLPETIERDTPTEIEAYVDYKAEDIVKMHHEGMSERAIAEKVKMSKTSVHNILVQYK